MKLGISMHIVRGVTNFEDTIDYYEKLGLKKLDEGNSPIRFALYTDGVMNLLISQDKMSFTGLIYFDDNQQERVKKLKEMKMNFFWKSTKGLFQAMFEVIPNLFRINLVEHPNKKKNIPNGKSLVKFGKFGELAIPITNYAETETKFNKLGFETKFKSLEPYPWGILTDGFIHIGLHQTSHFSSPTLTYFAEDMVEQIKALQSIGIKFDQVSEVAIESGNAKSTAPDGQVFFFFKGKI